MDIDDILNFVTNYIETRRGLRATQQQKEMFKKLGLGEFLPTEEVAPTFGGRVKQFFEGGPIPLTGPTDIGTALVKGKIGLINQIFLSRMLQGGDMGFDTGPGADKSQVPPKPTEPPTEGYEWELKEEKTTRAGIPSYNYRWIPKKIVETKEQKELITAPTLKPAKGFMQRRKKEFAGGLNEATVHAASRIKTKADLDDLIKNKEAYEAQDVDVNAILRYYKEIIPEALSKWYGVK